MRLSLVKLTVSRAGQQEGLIVVIDYLKFVEDDVALWEAGLKEFLKFKNKNKFSQEEEKKEEVTKEESLQPVNVYVNRRDLLMNY